MGAHLRIRAGFALAVCWLCSCQPKSTDLFPLQQLQTLDNTFAVDVFDHAVPLAFQTEKEIFFTSALGMRYSCSVSPFTSPSVSSRMPDNNVDHLLAQLQGQCLNFKHSTHSYWSYEWCYQKEIRQYHVEPGDPDLRRDPNWSLGSYISTKVIRQGDDHNNSAPIKRVIEQFNNGQWCDETQAPRSTEVHIKCCTPKTKRRWPGTATDPDNPGRNRIHNSRIDSIQEMQLCTYKMVVCSELLCPASSETEVVKSSLVEVMAEMNSTCVTKLDDWWTYELCIGGAARQFHAEQERDAEGRLKNVIKVTYILGKYPTHAHTNETALRAGLIPSKQGSLVARAGAKLLLEYTDGTPCGKEAPVNRSSTVEITCGAKNALTDATEDRTCHYRLKMTSKLLCEHPEFTPKTQPVTKIICAQHAQTYIPEPSDDPIHTYDET